MKTNFTFSIPTPCTQVWENFSTTSLGGFCSSCSKEVVDFSSMKDEQIASYLQSQSNGSVCGRFKATQLKAKSYFSIEPGITLLKIGLLSLFMLLSIQQISAQNTQTQATQLNTTSAAYTVKGIVRSSEDNAPMAGVNIYLRNTNEGIASDANGKFEFPRKLKVGEVLVFSFIGTEKQEYTITSSVPPVLEITMNLDTMIVLGMVSMDEAYAPRPAKKKNRKMF